MAAAKRDDDSQAQRDWFRVALGSIGDAVLATDVAGRITFMNAVAEDLTGWTSADAAGRPIDDIFRIVNEETRDKVENPATRALREGLVVGLANHTLLIAKDGTERPIDDSAAPIRGDGGAVGGVVLVFRDVTDRREAERALKDSEERFRLLVEGTRDYAIFMLDPQGRVASWNPGAERLKGWKANEIVGRHFSTFYPQEAVDAGWPQEELRRAEAEGRFEDEGRRIRKDGTSFWANVVISALRDDKGRLVGFSKITRDLTERKAAETELRAREERFRKVMESANDAIVTADAAGDVLLWNKAAARLFGYAEGEIVGRPISLLMPERYREAHAQGLKRLRETGDARLIGKTVELDGLRKNRTEFPLELSLSMWMTDAGPVYCGILRDVSERRQLLRAKAQADAMADLDRRKDEFLAMLSHELRNPLSPILNAVHLLRADPGDQAMCGHAAAIIERQVGHLTRLVDDLLDVSRITSGRIQLRQDHCDFSGVVERAVETAKPLVETHKHRLTVSLPDEPTWIYADPTRMEQVVVNLLANAAKYTEEGGGITAALAREDGEAVLRVRDTGVGISPELLPRVFELFTQGERSLDRSQGGLGVGLTVVQRLVAMHRGRVEAHSDGLGHGSEFVVRLPLAAAPADDDTTGTAPGALPTEKLRVLVVDDNRDSADSAAMLLRRTGHDVKTAYSGKQALDAARAFRPDAVLLDIGLPEMDGYEVARRIRADHHIAGVRLVAVSGYGQDFDRARSKEAGFDAHMVKPVDPRKILEALDGGPGG